MITEINQCVNTMTGNEKLLKFQDLQIFHFGCFKSSFSFCGLREKVYKHIGREEITHSKLHASFIWRKESWVKLMCFFCRRRSRSSATVCCRLVRKFPTRSIFSRLQTFATRNALCGHETNDTGRRKKVGTKPLPSYPV